MITKRSLISLACTGSLAAIFPDAIRMAGAEGTSRMLVGFGAGGAIDVIARMLVEGMKDHSPSFIVDNRPGAGGRLALGALKNSPADGTAMILTPASSVAVFPHVYKSLGYDAFRDFAPVTTVCSFPFLITVGPMVSADVKTLADFVNWCAANPKLATYGTAAAGSMLHFTGVTLAMTGRPSYDHIARDRAWMGVSPPRCAARRRDAGGLQQTAAAARLRSRTVHLAGLKVAWVNTQA